jgi:hypothetical protein
LCDIEPSTIETLVTFGRLSSISRTSAAQSSKPPDASPAERWLLLVMVGARVDGTFHEGASESSALLTSKIRPT